MINQRCRQFSQTFAAGLVLVVTLLAACGRAEVDISQTSTMPAMTEVRPLDALLSLVPTASSTTVPSLNADAAPRRAAIVPRDLDHVEPLFPEERLPLPAPMPTATRLPLLEYHYSTFTMHESVIMRTEWFEEQMRWVAENGFTTLTSQQLVDFIDGSYHPAERSVVLTFDVGYSKFDDYRQVVIPTLRRYGLHAIFFVLASRTQDTCDGEFACWETLAEWKAEGLISPESHTLWHIDYATLTPEKIAYDARRSKEILEEKLGGTVTGLSYPYDSVNPAVFPILERLGYRYAVGGPTRAERSVLLGDDEPFRLPRYYPYAHPDRYPVLTGSGGLTFEQMILGAINTGLDLP